MDYFLFWLNKMLLVFPFKKLWYQAFHTVNLDPYNKLIELNIVIGIHPYNFLLLPKKKIFEVKFNSYNWILINPVDVLGIKNNNNQFFACFNFQSINNMNWIEKRPYARRVWNTNKLVIDCLPIYELEFKWFVGLVVWKCPISGYQKIFPHHLVDSVENSKWGAKVVQKSKGAYVRSSWMPKVDMTASQL